MWCFLAVAYARIVQVQWAEVALCVCCRSAVDAASCPLWLSFLLLLSVAAEAVYQTPAARSYNADRKAVVLGLFQHLLSVYSANQVRQGTQTGPMLCIFLKKRLTVWTAFSAFPLDCG